MKLHSFHTSAVLGLLLSGSALAAETYQSYILQWQLPESGVLNKSLGQYIPGPYISEKGTSDSLGPITGKGAYFELVTVDSKGATTILGSTTVGAYTAAATVTITSEDPYATFPRTRADRMFGVQVTASGLNANLNNADAPADAKALSLTHSVLAYPSGTHGVGVDKGTATVVDTAQITQDITGTTPATSNLQGYPAYTVVPGTSLTKREGEETFKISTLAGNTPAQELDSVSVQIWPVADGAISGVSSNQNIRYSMPPVKFTYNDLYPDSETYVQVYKGAPELGKVGKVISGSAVVVQDSVPCSKEVTVSDWTEAFVGEDGVQTGADDGQWTMEILTKTPFGIDRLAYVSFNVDLTIEVNASVIQRE